MRLSDPLCNSTIPRVYFSSPSAPPEPEPVEPVEIPPVEPVELPPAPEPIDMSEFEVEEPTFREKYEMTPEIPMRRFQSKADEFTAAVESLKDPAYTHPNVISHGKQGTAAETSYEAKLARDLSSKAGKAQTQADRWRKETEIINPAALHVDDIIPPPASTGSTEAQEKADEEKRKQAGRQGMTSSIIAGEQTKDYASSATGTGSLLG